MRNLLIVSPHFPPVNAPDMQRVRLSLRYLSDCGWRPVVLAVDPAGVEAPTDRSLEQTIPEGVRVVRTTAWAAARTRRFGIGDLGLRAWLALKQAGDTMLDAGGIDLVYFSTTVFTAMTLGRIWKTRFGVPFVVDMQDAWITDYYRDKPRAQRPPKFWFADRLHRILEPWTMNQVDGLVAVSSAYIDVLQQRYPRLKDVPVRTLPFGAEPRDFEVIREDRQTNRLFAADDGLLHGVYVGRGGADMAPAVHALFRAFRRGLDERPGLFRHVRLHFGGTSYACDGRATKTIEPLAARYDLERYVSESPARLPYFEALQALTDSDFLIVPGSDDPQYTASKIYPYILARKPLIAIFRESSSVCDVLNRTNAGTLVPLTGVERTDYERAYAAFTDVVSRLPFVPSTDWEQFRPYHAAEMTRQQCEIFDDVLRRRAAVAAVVSPGDAAVASAGGAP